MSDPKAPRKPKLKLHPLKLEQALEAAMETGPPPKMPKKLKPKPDKPRTSS